MADKNSAFPALNPTYNDNYCKSEQRSNSILNLTSACMENGFCVDNLYAVNTGEKKWERRTDVHTQQRSWIAFQVMENWRYPRKKWGFMSLFPLVGRSEVLFVYRPFFLIT